MRRRTLAAALHDRFAKPVALGTVAITALWLGACGIKGTPPQPKDPAAVSDLRVEGRDGAIRISWRGRTGGVSGFDVLRRTETEDRVYFEKIGSVRAAGSKRYELYDRKPEVGTTYVYRVRALRKDPEPSDLRYTGPQGTVTWTAPLEPPTGVKSEPLNAGARLSWDPVPGADGYRIYQTSTERVLEAEPASRGLVEKTSWVAVALPDGKGQCWVVRAVKLPERLAEARNANVAAPDEDIEAPTGAEVTDAAATGLVIPRGNAGKEITRAVSELAGEGQLPGIESASSEATCTTPGLTEPPPPPKRVRVAVLDSGMSISWKESPSEEVTGYHVEREVLNRDGTPTDSRFRRITPAGAPVNAKVYLDRDVKRGSSYRYQVRAVDAAGSEGAPSTPTAPTPYEPKAPPRTPNP